MVAAADKNTDDNTTHVWINEETATFLNLVQVFTVFPMSITLRHYVFLWSFFLFICLVGLFNYNTTLCFLFCSGMMTPDWKRICVQKRRYSLKVSMGGCLLCMASQCLTQFNFEINVMASFELKQFKMKLFYQLYAQKFWFFDRLRTKLSSWPQLFRYQYQYPIIIGYWPLIPPKMLVSVLASTSLHTNPIPYDLLAAKQHPATFQLA